MTSPNIPSGPDGPTHPGGPTGPGRWYAAAALLALTLSTIGAAVAEVWTR